MPFCLRSIEPVRYKAEIYSIDVFGVNGIKDNPHMILAVAYIYVSSVTGPTGKGACATADINLALMFDDLKEAHDYKDQYLKVPAWIDGLFDVIEIDKQ